MAGVVSVHGHSVRDSLVGSQFLGVGGHALQDQKRHLTIHSHRKATSSALKTRAKLKMLEILGGRGLCNGEKGLEKELKRQVEDKGEEQQRQQPPSRPPASGIGSATSVREDAFEKEMMGLTGGFPGGEKGLRKFIEQNPPPPKPNRSSQSSPVVATADLTLSKKPKPPELPLLLPGMIAIVKNPNNPYYMYCGIVQRITDGRAGVLFEGGNWDRLITFRLEELERREKGPPMKNPKSAVLEPFLYNKP